MPVFVAFALGYVLGFSTLLSRNKNVESEDNQSAKESIMLGRTMMDPMPGVIALQMGTNVLCTQMTRREYRIISNVLSRADMVPIPAQLLPPR